MDMESGKILPSTSNIAGRQPGLLASPPEHTNGVARSTAHGLHEANGGHSDVRARQYSPSRQSARQPSSRTVKSDAELPKWNGSSVRSGGSSSLKQGSVVKGEIVSINSDGSLRLKSFIGGRQFAGLVREIRPVAPEPANRKTQPSVIVIGAGFAGLSAADELHALGCKVVVLEGRDRIGGRCWTDKSLDGRTVDLGAGWIHGIVGNPLAELARRKGVELCNIPADTLIHDADGVVYSEETDRKIELLFNQFLQRAQKEVGTGSQKSDQSLGGLLDRMIASDDSLDDARELQLFNWHCANIEYSTATDIHNLSARNWALDDENAFDGDHCLLKSGYCALAEHLAQGLDIRLNSKVKVIEHGKEGQQAACKVTLEDGRTLSSDIVVLTVPLGVLKSKSIAFYPQLPRWKQAAIDKLGFGVLNKVVLAFSKIFWQRATPIGKYIGYASERKGQFYLFIDITDCASKPTLLALISGSMAKELEVTPDDEVVREAMKVLEKVVGEGACEQPCGYKITRWGQDPFAMGSYSYVAIGCTPEDMDALARPLDHNRLFFAGEHTNSEHPSTVHGAFISGRRVARELLVSWHGHGEDQDRSYDMIAYEAEWLPEQSSCALCGARETGGIEGGLLGPFKAGGGSNRFIFVHENCALYTPEIGKAGGRWFNISKAVRRGRRLRCTRCGQNGATIGCYVDSCKVVMHWKCCLETEWDFGDPSLGKMFFCVRHRSKEAQRAVLNAYVQSSKGLDKNGMPAREDKKRKSNDELSGSSGKGKRKSLYARPLSLMGLPASSLLPLKTSKLACSLLTPELMATLDSVVPPGGEGARVEGAGGSNAAEGRTNTNG